MGKRLESLQRPSNILGEGSLDSAPERIDTAPFYYYTPMLSRTHTHTGGRQRACLQEPVVWHLET